MSKKGQSFTVDSKLAEGLTDEFKKKNARIAELKAERDSWKQTAERLQQENDDTIRELREERLKLEARVEELEEGLKTLLDVCRKPEENANESFERVAALYYKETGHMRPGKDESPTINVSDGKRRYEQYREWIDSKLLKAWNLITPPTDPERQKTAEKEEK